MPYAIADVAAVATQSYANTGYGPRAVDMLLAGVPLELVGQALRAGDEHAAQRQFGIVDADGGRSATPATAATRGPAASPSRASPRRATCSPGPR